MNAGATKWFSKRGFHPSFLGGGMNAFVTIPLEISSDSVMSKVLMTRAFPSAKEKDTLSANLDRKRRIAGIISFRMTFPRPDLSFHSINNEVR